MLALLAPDRARAGLPERAWGTYLGGAGQDAVTTVAVSGAGDVYACGYANSATGIATPGAHQEVLAGDYDAILVKFTPGGERVWGTYLGGVALDVCHTLAIDPEERVLVTGYTNSTAAIATPGALLEVLNDQRHGFAAQFDADGKRLWATYLPLPNTSWAQPVAAIGADGSRMIAGTVAGALPFDPPDAFQPVPGGGSQDAYLLALSPDGALLRGTYYGGAGKDGLAMAIAADAHGVVLALTTDSPGLATAGVHQEVPGGDLDAMAVRFANDGTRVWSTYFGGPSVEGQDTYIATAVAPDGGAWLVTDTRSSTGIASPGAHQAVLVGMSDLAVVRFNAAGKRLWSTYLGGAGDDYAGSLAVDAAGHGLVAQRTLNTGLATPDAFQTAPGGQYDDLVTRFDPAGNRLWATYYGGPASESIYAGGLAGDGLGTFYLAGATRSTSVVATPDAHQPAFGGDQDGLLVRLATGLGIACVADATCETNLCIDGVCCDKPCGGRDPGDCRACSVAAGAAQDGLCGTLVADTVCRPAAAACDAPEVCDGDAVACPADVDAADDTACDGGACQAGMCVPDEPASTGDTSTGSTGDAGTTTAGGTSTTGPDPTTGPGDPSTGAAPASTGELPDATTAPTDESGESGDTPGASAGGCGCAASPVPGDMSLGLLSLLALCRRRRAAAGIRR